jgi:hypothetical protein
MSIFSKTKKHVIQDRDFGRIEFHQDRWVGNAFFSPASKEVSLSLSGNQDGPYDQARREWADIPKRYQRLKSDISSALLELYSEHVAVLHEEDLSEDTPRIKTSDDVWEAFSLIVIAVNLNGDFELTYCFSQSNDDSLFAVSIKDDKIIGEFIGD